MKWRGGSPNKQIQKTLNDKYIKYLLISQPLRTITNHIVFLKRSFVNIHLEKFNLF